ncbi:hypothetical protein KZX46_08245 [Polymorphobacter sp. PAMC 29334]|nr:hypothetical protein KZX46_08245 [Polymorphobacter sp. PAMC 29334]
MQVALAWLPWRSPNVLLIPRTLSVVHLRENLAVAAIDLPEDAMATLDTLCRRRRQFRPRTEFAVLHPVCGGIAGASSRHRAAGRALSHCHPLQRSR